MMGEPSRKNPHGHKASPWQKETWRLESTCEVCDVPVVKVRASSKVERWQHAKR